MQKKQEKATSDPNTFAACEKLKTSLSGRHRGGGVMTLRLNCLRPVTRLFFRSLSTSSPLSRYLRPFTVSALDTKRMAMEKSRSQVYAQWSQAELISRILELERSTETVKPVHPRKEKKTFNSSLYSTRHIALKIAYLGANYGGFEYHANNPFSIPTVEEQIFKALLKSRLVPNNGLPGEEETVLGWPGDEAVEYSKCGRTDKGVSAFGQVIGIRVRSNRPKPPTEPTDDSDSEPPEFDDAKDELLYPQILNRLLPPDIRVLAWCPTPPPNFSARFSCQERHYRYFFTNPPIPPGTTSNDSSLLNIPLMREAAAHYIGNHDFRNFCKLDASKQITRFDRIITHSTITELTPLPPTFTPHPPTTSTPSPKIYYLELHGSAFLWHQVRHMIAILFLIGQGLEPPSLIPTLLDTNLNPQKPMYEMASDRALVLWDCVFPPNTLKWVYAGSGAASAWKEGRDDLVDNVWSLWHRARIDELLAGSLLDVIARTAAELPGGRGRTGGKSQVLVDGGSVPLYRGRYVPVLERRRMEDVDVINKRYVEKKGDWVENRNRRVEARKARVKAREGVEGVEGVGGVEVE